MADNDLLITISGAALSLLFYEYVGSRGDQMGFLLGENLEFVVKTYTDAENQIETVKRHNNIETVVTCPLPDLLHDSIGKVNKEKLKDFMRDKSKQVIGWFRFRRNTNLVLTMRDKMLHREFASYFSGGNGCAEEFFVTCLLSSSITSDKGTHKFRHVFLRRTKGMFEPVPLKIINLGNDLTILDGSDYKPAPTKNLSNTPDVFSKLIESLSLDVTRTSGLESAIRIQKVAEQYLDKLIPQLCESDHEVAELERQIKEFEHNRKSKLNGSTNNIDKKCEVGKDGVCRKSQKLDKLSPCRIGFPENVCEERQMLNDNCTATSQATFKNKNTAACQEKCINQTKSKKPTADVVNSTDLPRQDSPPIKSATQNRRYCNMESEIVKESICKETLEIGVGRGRGKYIRNAQSGLKKARTSEPIATRSISERTSHSQVSHQEPSEANCVQNTSSQVSYSQIAQKKTDNTRKSDTANNY
ncbi:BRISC complex subunit FAM175B [Lasioglossum baleicum]|uniref:BRISC complex subunit FAM175B n=1 Tax=Lasioglossum baleicum TaxID=434251 RepID=UPI003FCE7B30